ncbi:hypothetical protein E4U60_005174 [Claviceps pazoutovae]|uniref:Uncharacterized protein n=1 Tax=Claviceps pazoutovae TaxID=1649127 RepID=A0A9P7M822_9HYPO|nr:hypothetical protein E4U60_005174 [Claviceps pazoutovae]
MKNILNLTNSEDSLDNGDSYTYFAQAAELGCIVQDDRLVDGSFKNEKAKGVYIKISSGDPAAAARATATATSRREEDKGKPKPSGSRQGGSGDVPNSS